MSFELSVYHVIVLVGALVGAFWALAKMMLGQTDRMIREQFADVKRHLKDQDETQRRLERELMDLKAELPRDYVRREDYTQAIALIMTKLDAMALRFEAVVLRSRNGSGRGEG